MIGLLLWFLFIFLLGLEIILTFVSGWFILDDVLHSRKRHVVTWSMYFLSFFLLIVQDASFIREVLYSCFSLILLSQYAVVQKIRNVRH